jgi:arylsulfatase A-like enzyme
MMAAVVLLMVVPLRAGQSPAKALPGVPPNILIILADDLGYGDVQCYNPQRGKIPTPNMDRLAAEGMRFMDAHSSSGVCSPSRYALLTGRYHWRTRLQQGIVPVWGAPLIAPDRLTVAGLATQRGYRTACIGKWHLGRDWPITEQQRKYFTGFGGWPGAEGGHSTATERTCLWQESSPSLFPAGPRRVASTSTSAPMCRTGRHTASLRTSTPSVSQANCYRQTSW